MAKRNLSVNYCRNPSGHASPWCYTSDPSVRWEYCRLNTCPATTAQVPSVQETSTKVPPGESDAADCYWGNGQSYRGTAATTSSGRTCQPWSSQTPHRHCWTPQAYPHANLSMNYCRNPSGDPSPWCFTSDPEVPWEYCRLSTCPETEDDGSDSRSGPQVPSAPYPCEPDDPERTSRSNET
ncbi:PREDICTED: plasminogen-like [Condylura cristata]|uniref:plasminogen-like n=1 Tax=Condylura cristata TaxID=143302 RepID=UPI000643186A|nr:PREDICTED: plasminogen-like [Condylura cristata]